MDYHPHAVAQLRRLYEYAQPLDHYYEGMQQHPDTFWDFIKERGVLDMPHFHTDEVNIEQDGEEAGADALPLLHGSRR